MVTVRNYIRGEAIPWTQADIGWSIQDLDPEWTWVVFADHEIAALLVGAKVMNSILLLRLLSKSTKTWWIRSLWREIRSVCLYRGIVGYWTCMDNGREAERKLLVLLRQGRCNVSPTATEAGDATLVRGRF